MSHNLIHSCAFFNFIFNVRNQLFNYFLSRQNIIIIDDFSEDKTKDEKLIADMSKYSIDYQVEKTNNAIKNNAIRTTANKICWALVLLIAKGNQNYKFHKDVFENK